MESIEQPQQKRPSSMTTTNLMASIRIVSMNVSNCQPSAEAPRDWTDSKQIAALQQELLHSSKNSPDILALQECPTEDWAKDIFANTGYHCMGCQPSHMGYVALLFRNALSHSPSSPSAESNDTNGGISVERVSLPPDMPVVLVRVKETPKDSSASQRTIYVASCHLEPFKGGADERYYQIQTILQFVQANSAPSSSSWPVIIAGDTNMRVAEDAVMEQGFHLLDAWKLAGAYFPDKYTWNTRDNRKKNGKGSFNRYYGDDTREYVARYDRIYVHQGNGDKAFLLRVPHFQLIANKPILPSKTHFLSDHFGISAKLRFNWGPSGNSRK